MAMYIVECSGEGNVPLRSHFSSDQFTSAAIDNFDHEGGNLFAKGSHDTVSVIFQNKLSNVALPCQYLKNVHKPTNKPDVPLDYTVSSNLYAISESKKTDLYKTDVAWSVSRMDSENIEKGEISTMPQFK